MPEEEPLYVGIPFPLDLRKDLLNSSSDIIKSLKGYEKFMVLKEAKMNHTLEILKIMREITSLTRKLKQAMPKTSIKPGAIKPTVSVSTRIIKEKTKLAELEDELVNVEEELGRME